MFEFDFSVTVTEPSKGLLNPRKIVVPVVDVCNRLDATNQLKKKLLQKNQTLHVVLDIQCFKRNIRKERVQVSDDELDKILGTHLKVNLGSKPDLFKRKEPWEF